MWLEGKEEDQDTGESNKAHGEQFSKKKNLAGRLERMTKGVSSGFEDE